MRRFVLIFNHFEEVHLGKDVYLFPYYWKQEYGDEVEIVYPSTPMNKDFPSSIKGVKLSALRSLGNTTSFFLYREWNFVVYLLKNARSIDILFRFHYTLMTAIMILLYKFFNKRGKVYVKLDGYIDALFLAESRFLRDKIKKYILLQSLEKVDLLTCETSTYYKKLMTSNLLSDCFKRKLRILENGFDEDELISMRFQERNIKENIMITVGRLGTFEKNTEMLLNALAKVDLKDWKFYLIGPVEESFRLRINDFFRQYPEKKVSVIVVDAIYDKKKLWDFYNRSKIFVLTSRSESYALVLNEALRFKNYIISTEVGAAEDLIKGKYGSFVEQDNSDMLASRPQSVIAGETNLDVFADFDPVQLSWRVIIKRFFESNSL